MKLKIKTAAMISLVLAILVFGTGLATVITIDGVGTDWPGDPGPCTPGDAGCSLLTTDPKDLNLTGYDQYDIEQVWGTNSSTNLFLRLDTYGQPGTWSQSGAQFPVLDICLDADNDPATGVTAPVSFCNYNNTMDGVDYFIQITGIADAPSVTAFRQCPATGGTWPCPNNNTKRGHTTVGYADGHLSEVSILLSDLGIDTAECGTGCEVATGFYFDNGAAPNEDSIPDAPPYINIPVGGGSPTAITLTSMNVQAKSSAALPLMLGGAVLFLLSLGLFAFTRVKRLNNPS